MEGCVGAPCKARALLGGQQVSGDGHRLEKSDLGQRGWKAPEQGGDS